jgi:DedD protein
MTEQQKAPDQDAANEEDPRKQLWVRVGVAGGLIGLLLGGLAVFDHLSRPPVPAEIALPTKPIAPAQVVPEAGRDVPPDVVRAGSETAEKAPAEEAPAEAEGSAPPKLPEGDKVEPAGKVAEGTRPVLRAPAPVGVSPAPSVEAARKPAPRADEAPRLARTPAPAAAVVPAPVGAAAAAARPAAVVSAPAQQLAPAAQPTAAAGKAEASQAYVLQFGVFSNVASAENLRTRLAQTGIPSQLEVRVVVGPFADRKDALAAQARLRDKGIDIGTVIPLGR